MFAVGVKVLTRGSITAPLEDAARLALCGGVALYLVGHAAFALRMVGEVEYEKLGVAVALLVLYAVGGGLVAWVLAGAVAVLMGALCAAETDTVREADQRRADARAGRG